MEVNAVTIGLPIAGLIAAGVALWYVNWAHKRLQKDKHPGRKQPSQS